MAEPMTALTDTLVSRLQRETLVLLNTIDAETGAPTMNAISWVYALDGKTIRFALDGRSRLIANIKANPNVTLSFFAGNQFLAVYGTARVVTEKMEDVPFKLACIEVDVREVRDAMFYGARISALPEYEKTYDQRAADKLDGQVFEALKKA